jgi:4-carboxymuconolactone decarboxylase
MRLQPIFYSLLLIICAGVGASNNVIAQDMKLYPGKTDVYYSSGNRLPPVDRNELDEMGKGVYDKIVKSGRSFTYDEENKEYMGPRAIRMYSPIVGDNNSRSNQYLRYESGMDPKLREITIMHAAISMNSSYEWTAHEEAAMEEGVPREIIDIVKYNKPIPTNLGDKETVLINLCRELVYGNHLVSPDTFAKALALFGKKQLVEFVALLGGYTATAMILNTFDQQLPPGKKTLLP